MDQRRSRVTIVAGWTHMVIWSLSTEGKMKMGEALRDLRDKIVSQRM
jgi:hypothetical protein